MLASYDHFIPTGQVFVVKIQKPTWYLVLQCQCYIPLSFFIVNVKNCVDVTLCIYVGFLGCVLPQKYLNRVNNICPPPSNLIYWTMNEVCSYEKLCSMEW